MFVLMVTEYLKRHHFSQVLFSSALGTNVMLSYSGDLNLAIFSFDNFSPSTDFIMGKTRVHRHVGRSGPFRRLRTPEGEQTAQCWVKHESQLSPVLEQGRGFQKSSENEMTTNAVMCQASMHPTSPLVPVFQL